MRKLTDHQVGGLNEVLLVKVLDAPGNGGANHEYSISNPGDPLVHCGIIFQNGPVGEVGVNGVSQEALLAIVIDRLRGFQSGAYATRENALALTHIETGLMWLQKRTRDRLARGVEGTSAK